MVNEGIKLGFADLVDPKSMTLDIKALLGTLTQDTNAIGVVKVEVREAARDGSIKIKGKKYIRNVCNLFANCFIVIYRYGGLLCYFIFKYSTQEEFI